MFDKLLTVCLVLTFCLVTLGQKTELKTYFDHLDLNKDGILDEKEFAHYFLGFTERTAEDEIKSRNFAKIFLENKTHMDWSQFQRIYNSLNVADDGLPEQIHLAVTQNADEMKIMWATVGKKKQDSYHSGQKKSTVVRYGVENLDQEAAGVQWTYNTPKPYHTDKYMQKVLLKGLKPGTLYKYQVGDKISNEWSKVHHFNTLKDKFPLRLITFGDMGIIPMGFLVSKEIEYHYKKEPFDLVTHVGDIVYADLGSNGKFEFQRLWDLFQRQLEPYASRVPYMVTSGNHEQYYNYTAYNNRWSMPENGKQNMFYSHDFGGMHLISINTETSYDSLEPGSPQYQWIERDLQRANANRHNVPWIMIQGHRPMYNTVPGETSIRRNIEPLLMKYKVDIALWGHFHCYYRSYPVFNGRPFQTSGNIYRNPQGPVQLMVGSGGAGVGVEKNCGKELLERPMFAFSDDTHYGFGRMTVYNGTHLKFQFLRVRDSKYTDEMWIIKNQQ